MTKSIETRWDNASIWCLVDHPDEPDIKVMYAYRIDPFDLVYHSRTPVSEIWIALFFIPPPFHNRNRLQKKREFVSNQAKMICIAVADCLFPRWSHQMEILAIIGHLCGEVTGHRWIPLTKSNDAEFWFFICSWTNGWANHLDAGEIPSRLLWRHCNDWLVYKGKQLVGYVFNTVQDKNDLIFQSRCMIFIQTATLLPLLFFQGTLIGPKWYQL